VQNFVFKFQAIAEKIAKLEWKISPVGDWRWTSLEWRFSILDRWTESDIPSSITH